MPTYESKMRTMREVGNEDFTESTEKFMEIVMKMVE
jgi:hypothetical protein